MKQAYDDPDILREMMSKCSNSSSTGTITGLADGGNQLFGFNGPIILVQVFKNGILQTAGIDYSLVTGQINFSSCSIL